MWSERKKRGLREGSGGANGKDSQRSEETSSRRTNDEGFGKEK